MIRFTAVLAAAYLAAVCANAATITVNVQSQSGTPVEGAQVMAAVFGTGYPGPDPVKSSTGVTDGTGSVSLTLLDNVGYEIFASSQGFLPAFVDQMNNPSHPHVQGTGALSAVTVKIDSTGVSGVGEIDVDVQGASPSGLVVADVAPANGGDPIAVGYTYVDNAGNAGNGSVQPAIKLLNVSTTSAGSSYRVEGQNLKQKSFYSFPGTVAMDNSHTYLYYTMVSGTPALQTNLNFTQAIAAQQTQGSQTSGGSVSMQGVVTDGAGNVIPGVGMNFLYCTTDAVFLANNNNNCWTHIWASSDQSGSVNLGGLQKNTTYYSQINGACNNGTCYQGSTSANFTAQTQGAAPGPNDFVYNGTPVLKQFQLSAVAGGSGHMAIYVKDNNGNPLPGAWVNIYPDFSSCAGTQNPGYSQFNGQATTGYVLVDNLLPGRYNINVGTPFSTSPTWFNAGADGQSNCDADDLVVLVDTTNTSGQVYITQKDGVTSAGYAPALSSVTVNVTLATNNSGTVAGTITLPAAEDLSSDPITLSLYPQNGCQNGPCQGGYAVITNAVGTTTGPVISYAIHVASGTSYYLNTQANYWGLVHQNGGGQLTADLTNAPSVTANLVFAPAGRIVGKLYNPDGTLFVPTQSTNGPGVTASIQAECNSSWGWTQANKDGTYAIGGVLPGVCTLNVQGYGGYSYTNKLPIPKVTVVAGQDVYSDVQTVNAQTVQLAISTSHLQGFPPTVGCQYGSSDHCTPEYWSSYVLPHGTAVTPDVLLDMLNTGNGHANTIGYRPIAGGNGKNCDGGGSGTPAGFCSKSFASPNVYDFRLMRDGDFDSRGSETLAARPYFVVLNSTSSIAVDAAHANQTPVYVPEEGSTVTVVSVNLDPGSQLAVSTAVFVGTVTAQNMITQHDFLQLGGDFQNFLKFLPTITLYDSSGSLVAGGLTVPYPPAENPYDARLSSDVAIGNWTDFAALTSASTGWGPMGFDIRGIPVGTYTMVVQTPNYPLYSTKVTLTAGSNRLDVNLDSLVGQGATLTGTITDKNTTLPLKNVPVTISADNYPAQTVTTDSNGVYTRLGLPAGQFTVAPALADYALNSALVNVPANTAVTQNFAMVPASGKIFGSVAEAGVTHALLVGAKVVAYDQTASIANPAAAQTLYSVNTDTSGVYHLSGLITGDTYYVSVEAERTLPTGAVIQYYITSQTSTAAANGNELDFTLAKKPLDVLVVGHASPDKTAFDFSILNPGNFDNGNAWIGESPFSKLTSTNVAQGPSSWGTFQNFTDSQGRKYLALHYLNTGLVNPANTQVLHIEALSHDSLTGKDTVYVKEVTFAAGGSASTTQSFDRALLGDGSDNDLFVGRKSNEVPISDDATQNPSAVQFPVGSLLPINAAAVPTLSFTAQDTAQTLGSLSLLGAQLRASGITANTVSGQIYNLTLSSANYVAGGPGINVSLAYDKSDANLGDLALYHYNTTTKQWDPVGGTQTIDPIKGTVTAQLKSLSAPAGLRNNSALLAQAVGGVYRTAASVALVPDDSGLFAILHPSGITNAGYAGSILNVYNFPNPFNLFDKTVPIKDGGAGNTQILTGGTVIKYEIPAGAGGHVYIRIYTISGQLVKELDEGDKAGGTYNYTVWDGHNSSGSPVANGVYYGIASVPGTKVKAGTFKLVVIK